MCSKGLRRHKTLSRKEIIATAKPASIILDSGPGEKPRSTVLGVIPARLASTRLSRKVLRPLAGKPMLAWVYEAARACPQLTDVLIATDSEEVADICRHHSWPFSGSR